MIKRDSNIYFCWSWKVRKISILNLPRLAIVENVLHKRCVAIGLASSGARAWLYMCQDQQHLPNAIELCYGCEGSFRLGVLSSVPPLSFFDMLIKTRGFMYLICSQIVPISLAVHPFWRFLCLSSLGVLPSYFFSSPFLGCVVLLALPSKIMILCLNSLRSIIA